MKKKKQLNKRANTLTVNVTPNIHASRFNSSAKFVKKGLIPVNIPFPATIAVTDFPVTPSVPGRRKQLKLKEQAAAAAATATASATVTATVTARSESEEIANDDTVNTESAHDNKESADDEDDDDDDDDDDDGDDERDGGSKSAAIANIKVRANGKLKQIKPKAAIALNQLTADYAKKSRKQRVELVTNVSKAVLILICRQRGVPAAVYEPMNFKQIMTHVRSFDPMVHMNELLSVQSDAGALQIQRKAKFAEIKDSLKAAGRDRATIKQKKREEAAARRRAAREEQEEIVRRKREADEAEAKRRGVPYVPPPPRKKRQKLDVYGIDRETERRRRAEETSSSDDDSEDSELEVDSQSSEDEDERNAKRNLIWARKKRRNEEKEDDDDNNDDDAQHIGSDNINKHTSDEATTHRAKKPRTETASSRSGSDSDSGSDGDGDSDGEGDGDARE